MCEFWSGIAGAAIGAIAALAGVVLTHALQTSKERRRDEGRKSLLRQMLDKKPPGKEWRELKTIARVVGADHDETARLLIDIGARGSEGENEVWAYVKDKPLP